MKVNEGLVAEVFMPGDNERRRGRGFSVGELKAVGLTLKQALKMGIKVDVRRRSVHEWNVEALKNALGLTKKRAKRTTKRTTTRRKEGASTGS